MQPLRRDLEVVDGVTPTLTFSAPFFTFLGNRADTFRLSVSAAETLCPGAREARISWAVTAPNAAPTDPGRWKPKPVREP